MQKTLRQLADILATLIGLNPNQRLAAILLMVAGIVTLNWFSDGALSILDGSADYASPRFWIQLLALPLVLFLFVLVTWGFYRQRNAREGESVNAQNPPEPHQGIIIFLSTFRTFASKLPASCLGENWRQEDLLLALANEHPDWPHILDHVQASNMQVPLEAIQFHYANGMLRKVWVLATKDMHRENGAIQPGSKHLVETFERILKEGMGMDVDVIFDDSFMAIPAYDMQASFDAVRHIYGIAPRHGLPPEAIIADITGGTVTMTAGMVLYGALLQRDLQYTAATNEPMEGKPLDRPQPYGIRIDHEIIQHSVLRQMLVQKGVSSS